MAGPVKPVSLAPQLPGRVDSSFAEEILALKTEKGNIIGRLKLLSRLIHPPMLGYAQIVGPFEESCLCLVWGKPPT